MNFLTRKRAVNILSTTSLVALTILSSAQLMAGNSNPDVGGAPMYASKNIIENAVNSKAHTTLVAAVKAAGLVDTLQGRGLSLFLLL
ncbi:MAG: putative surface protein with fasciclin (FAS1) repeats [Candidatus Endobugula sp.]|jgi:uncharacterized surface protein with fasciclin (FAS1) repeats